MPDADPLGGDGPYEKLGVSGRMTVDKIKTEKDALVGEYKNKVRTAKQNDDNDLYRDAQNALRAIDEAWDWIQKNHEPPGIDKQVSISAVSPDVRLGDTAVFEVVSPDGPEADVPVDVDRRSISSKRTNQNGTVEFSFDAIGTVQATARTTSEYTDPTTNIEVERREAQLRFVSAPKEVEIGDQATFRVTDSNGNFQDSVQLAVDGEQVATTDDSGRATVSFDDVKRVQVTASKPKDAEATYSNATTTVGVTEETVHLNLDIETSDVTVGDTVSISVKDGEGTPVQNAEVDVNGEDVTTTDRNGTASVTLPEATSIELTASKTPSPDDDRVYEPNTVRISPDKRRDSLRIDDISGEFMEGDDVIVTVLDESGVPVENAKVTSNWRHSESTDVDGEAVLTLDDHGTLTVEATKSSSYTEYDSASKTLEVKEFTRQLRFDEIPNTAEPGENISIRITDQQGTPVDNVEIRTNQRFESWYTDPDGWARVPLDDDIGVVRLTVEKDEGDDFNDATATETIHVR